MLLRVRVPRIYVGLALWEDGGVSAHRDIDFRFRYLPGGSREEPLATFVRNDQLQREAGTRPRIDRALEHFSHG